MFKQRLLAKYVLADTQEATGPASKDWRIPKLPDDLKFPKTDRERRYLGLVNSLMKIATQDSMTGLSHKEHFMGESRETGAYIFIDGDGLKKLNDKYGHEAGHAAILAIGDAVKRMVRDKTEVKTRATRAGGDEFMVHIENVSLATGVVIAKRILDAIRARKISDFFTGSPEKKRELESVALTASLGVGATIEDADVAVYKAKANGRNRVEFVKKQQQAA